MTLNEEQTAAISASSPTLVNASAGAGKTRCLVAKVLSLLERGVSPSSILSITFTNKAANEMKSRIREQWKGSIDGMQVSTIHSMCVRIIRTFPQHTPLKVPFSIYDEDDQLQVMKTLLKARNMTDRPWDILGAISLAKSGGHTENLDGLLRDLYLQYGEILRKNNAADFDDLLIYANDCMKHADCRDRFSQQWRHILVDETQDTSKVQYDIVLALYNPAITKTLFIVGDVAQSIYSWRGAQPGNMQSFISKYHPTVCHLTYNYRSAPEIIKFANVFQQFNPPMEAKGSNKGSVSVTQFESLMDEAEKVATAIERMSGYEETAILYRVNSRSLEFERALARRRIPYKVVGDVPFFRRKTVKDILAMLRASNNPSDIESLARVINVPKRGFGDTKIEQLLLQGRPYVEKVAQSMPAVEGFLNTLAAVRGKAPREAIQELLHATGYRQSLQNEYDGVLIDTLLEVASSYDDANEMLVASSLLEQDSGRGVKLMSAHASKGLEFDRVFVVGIEREVWPHALSADMKEEEHLFYVACTRARKWLNVSYSKNRTYKGKPSPMDPSSLFLRSYKAIMGKDLYA